MWIQKQTQEVMGSPQLTTLWRCAGLIIGRIWFQKSSLRQLVSEDTDDEVPEMFKELFQEVLPQVAYSNGFTDEDEVDEHMISCVMQWLRSVLESIL